MEHAKNYEIRCKIFWNIRTNEWHRIARQCNLRFLSKKVLQGSVATCLNYGRIFIDSFTENLLQSVRVKEFWNRLAFRRVTGKNKVALFSGHGVDYYTSQNKRWWILLSRSFISFSHSGAERCLKSDNSSCSLATVSFVCFSCWVTSLSCSVSTRSTDGIAGTFSVAHK